MSTLPDQDENINVYDDFVAFLKKIWLFLKPNPKGVMLFVISKEFHRWQNANEKIFPILSWKIQFVVFMDILEKN